MTLKKHVDIYLPHKLIPFQIFPWSNIFRGVVTPTLSQDKMKRVYIATPDLHGKSVDKFFNKKMVILEQNYDDVNLPIAWIVGIIYGKVWNE